MFTKYNYLLAGFGATVIVLGGFWLVNGSRQQIAESKTATVLNAQNLSSLTEGQTVVISGKIADGPPLYKNMVMGILERYYEDPEGGGEWEVEEAPEARLQIEVAPKTQVSVLYEDPTPEGYFTTLKVSETERYKGYVLGELLTTIATVSTVTPISFEAKAHSQGDLVDYQHHLQAKITMYQWFVGIILLIYCLVMFYSFKNGGFQAKTSEED